MSKRCVICGEPRTSDRYCVRHEEVMAARRPTPNAWSLPEIVAGAIIAAEEILDRPVGRIAAQLEQLTERERMLLEWPG